MKTNISGINKGNLYTDITNNSSQQTETKIHKNHHSWDILKEPISVKITQRVYDQHHRHMTYTLIRIQEDTETPPSPEPFK